jgi:hypothetical protein
MQRGCAYVSTVSLSLCYRLEARRQSINVLYAFLLKDYLNSTAPIAELLLLGPEFLIKVRFISYKIQLAANTYNQILGN